MQRHLLALRLYRVMVEYHCTSKYLRVCWENKFCIRVETFFVEISRIFMLKEIEIKNLKIIARSKRGPIIPSSEIKEMLL